MERSHEQHDPFARGKKSTSNAGTLLFVALRILDLILQYGILRFGWASTILHFLHVNVLPDSAPLSTGISLLDHFELSPYRFGLFSFATASSLKQILWATRTNEGEFGIKHAISVAAANTFCNTLNSILATTSFFSPVAHTPFPQAQFLVGAALLVFGMLIESISESQRKSFKVDERNQGKVYTGGLWSLARHINYTGFTMWRAGYTMASAGWVMGLVMGAIFFRDFGARAIPILDTYCAERYGAQWDNFKTRTPYRMVPGIW